MFSYVETAETRKKRHDEIRRNFHFNSETSPTLRQTQYIIYTTIQWSQGDATNKSTATILTMYC